jgi:hypothetical protein
MPHCRIVNLHLEIEDRRGRIRHHAQRGEPVLLVLVLGALERQLDDLELLLRRELGAGL